MAKNKTSTQNITSCPSCLVYLGDWRTVYNLATMELLQGGKMGCQNSKTGFLFEMFPVLKDNLPNWIGHGGEVFFGGTLSINLLSSGTCHQASSEAFSNALLFVFGVCLVINGMRRCCRWTYDSPFTTLLNTATCTHQSQLRVPASSCSMDGSANGTAFYDVFV
ncbi:hypothetical protein D5086_025630 [Populus alba]|uniref:Uncharacterized protein n=1 Tax=Populus alba TaxID=43335 RepID=A0ACC4B055_POPAL